MSFDELDLSKRFLNDDSNNGRTMISGNDYLSYPPDCIQSGQYCLNGEDGKKFYLTDKMLSMGLLLLGSTGCGKTTTFFQLLDQVVPKIQQQDIMIIFDSKHDFRKRYYDPNNPNHVLISLDPNDGDVSAVWNVFCELCEEDGCFKSNTLDLNCKEISNMLFKGLESESQPFFNISAADFIAKVMATMIRNACRTKDFSNLNNFALNERLSKNNENDNLISFVTNYKEYEYLKTYVGNGQSNQALGIYAYMGNVKERSFIGPFGEKPESGVGFGVRDFIRRKGGKILFLEFDIRYRETLSVLYSLFFELAIKEALSDKVGNKWFICDEANLIPYVSSLQDLLNLGRSLGCKTAFGLQSFAQFKNQYKDSEAESLAAGFCNLFAFQNTDYSSRDYVKQRSGETFEAYNYGSSNITRESFTITDSAMRNLSCGEAFIDLKNVPIFKFQFSDVNRQGV